MYGPRKSGVDWLGWQAEAGALATAAVADDPQDVPAPIATSARAFVDDDAYATQTYYTAARALFTLEGITGSAKFLAAMKAYSHAFAFKHPTARDLYATLEQELGQDLGWFFEPVFQRVGGIELSVRQADCALAHGPRGVFGDDKAHKTKGETEEPTTGTYVCTVVIQNTGVVHVPVEIEISFADGSSQRVLWDDHESASWQKFVIERSSPIVRVRIDPDSKIALANPVTHDVRVDGDRSATLRAGARIGWWAQTLMQLMGP
jgi:hypothetical protein